MMQGDSYALPLEIKSDGDTITPDTLVNIEVSIGKIVKTMKDGGVSYDGENGVFLAHLSQDDTFALTGREIVQARLKFVSGDVRGVDFGEMFVDKSISKVVL